MQCWQEPEDKIKKRYDSANTTKLRQVQAYCLRQLENMFDRSIRTMEDVDGAFNKVWDMVEKASTAQHPNHGWCDGACRESLQYTPSRVCNVGIVGGWG